MPKTVALEVPAHDSRRHSAALAAAAELAEAKDINVVVLTHRPPVDPRSVYAPNGGAKPAGSANPDVVIQLGSAPVRDGLWQTFRGYYRDPVAWLALLVTSILLCYAGGAAMFYVHSIYFGEGGPAISPYLHWALDSTFGFIALTPVIAVLLPLSTWLARRLPKWSFVVVLGVLFAIVTIPGPLAHDLVVARGTPISMMVTHVFGDPDMVMPPSAGHSALAKMTHQFVAGLPVYLALSAVSFGLVRVLVRKS